MSSILFLCTGNYYRSRVAEIYLNHHIEQLRLPWTVTSRGLAESFSEDNVGSISRHAIKTLETWRIPIPGEAMARKPVHLQPDDFAKHDRIIAVSENEHLPMMQSRFPDYLDHVSYFEIGDLWLEPRESAMPRLREELNTLLSELVGIRD